MNITKDKLISLVSENLYEDMIVDEELFYSKIAGLYAIVDSKEEHHNMLTLNKDRYDTLVKKAYDTGNTPAYVCSTPIGIWEFDLEIIKPEVDNSVVYIPVDRGRPILPWYPDFDSEAEFNADALSEYSENREDAHELELLIQEMIDSEVDFDKEFDPSVE
jgi:hypothetical protein